MYNKHISTKYAQAIARQLGIYTVNDSTVCMISALVDTLLLQTAEKWKGAPLDRALVPRAIMDIFPREFARELLLHANKSAESVPLQVSSILAEKFMANPNKIQSKSKRSSASTLTPNINFKLDEEIDNRSETKLDHESFTKLLRERCASYNNMGGKLIKITADKLNKKPLSLPADQSKLVDQLAILLNEAMEYLSRLLLRGAVLETQKALSLEVANEHLTALGKSDPNFTTLFDLLNLEKYHLILPTPKSGNVNSLSLHRDPSKDGSVSPTLSRSSHCDSSLASPRPKNLFTDLTKKFYSAISGTKSTPTTTTTTSHPNSAIPSDSEELPSLSPRSSGSGDSPRNELQDYLDIDLVSQPQHPAFVMLEGGTRSSMPQPECAPDFETLFESGNTLKLFVSRAARHQS